MKIKVKMNGHTDDISFMDAEGHVSTFDRSKLTNIQRNELARQVAAMFIKKPAAT